MKMNMPLKLLILFVACGVIVSGFWLTLEKGAAIANAGKPEQEEKSEVLPAPAEPSSPPPRHAGSANPSMEGSGQGVSQEESRNVRQNAKQYPSGSSGSGTYKWVDDKGTIHFSDRPTSAESRQVEVRPINTYQFIEVRPDPAQAHEVKPERPSERHSKRRLVSASDYSFFNSGFQSGDNVILSGRVSDGPECKALRLTIRAQSSRGKSIVATTVVNDVGWGSKLYRVVRRSTYPKYSAWPTWEITDVQASCAD